MYFVSVTTVGSYVTDWMNNGIFGEGWSLFGNWIPGIPVIVESFLSFIGTADWLNSLIIDGIIGGVGAVLGFVPQMLVLFLLLAFLEACGYMARIAFVLDRIFRKFGLSGKSFIPILIGTGCGVPGIMASRTIENERDRRMTIMTTTFIPCGAKVPFIGMIAGAICNDGNLMRPYLVDHTENASGALVEQNKPASYKQIMSKDQAAFLQNLMAAVVSDGTGAKLSDQSYEAFGKTGTAQVSDSTDQTNAWFVGYGKKDGYNDLAIAVIVEDSGAGSTYAVPVAKKTMTTMAIIKASALM